VILKAVLKKLSELPNTDGGKDVIVVIKGSEMPYPDVTGVSVNEDTVVLEAEVFDDQTP
jgi:hypothetical protein